MAVRFFALDDSTSVSCDADEFEICRKRQRERENNVKPQSNVNKSKGIDYITVFIMPVSSQLSLTSICEHLLALCKIVRRTVFLKEKETTTEMI